MPMGLRVSGTSVGSRAEQRSRSITIHPLPAFMTSSPFRVLAAWLGLAGVLLLALCSGCIPLRFTTSPGASGRIVDAHTHTPISGAEIVISRSTYPPSSPDSAYTNSRSPKVMTRDDGRFSVPFERRLDLYFVPIDIFPRFGLLVVKRSGYATTCVPFWSRSMAELGEIQVISTNR
jgi:hypothetical protein